MSEKDKIFLQRKRRSKKLRDYLESSENPEVAFENLVHYLSSRPIEIPENASQILNLKKLK